FITFLRPPLPPFFPYTTLFRSTDEALRSFFNSDYRISNQSDRMGYRLEGPNLPLRENKQLLSEGATFGSIQVPADGLPIVLMAEDRKSTRLNSSHVKISYAVFC